ncbi:hypothetical protein BDW22DRAFT_1425942 [Trametopsis cervina]|nr:hypothetical protein BDW22DRAFT_1425942 [Trametopsis cervina]
MKPFAAVAAFVACVFAQRVSILEPTPGTMVVSGTSFIAELHQDETTSSLSQISVTLSVTACFDVCNDSTKWGPGTVLYNAGFNPQFDPSQPQKGLFQDIPVVLPAGWPEGESVLQVAHLFTLGALGTLSFDYTEAHFNLIDPSN